MRRRSFGTGVVPITPAKKGAPFSDFSSPPPFLPAAVLPRRCCALRCCDALGV
jgi:hypothetical protein